MSRFDIRRTLSRVVTGRSRFRLINDLALRLGEIAFQIRHTPSTSGAGSPTFADLTRSSRPMHADEIQDLPFGNVEAVADGVVDFHARPVKNVECKLNANQPDYS